MRTFQADKHQTNHVIVYRHAVFPSKLYQFLAIIKNNHFTTFNNALSRFRKIKIPQ